MEDAVICTPLRTPVGRFLGALKEVEPAHMAATVIRGIIARTSLEPSVFDDVILGQCYPNGEAPAIGRVAALEAGLPVEVPGLQLDRRCGSGLQAICMAAMQVQTGVSSVVIAGGVESMSHAEFYATNLRSGHVAGNVVLHDRLARARVTAGSSRHPVPGGMLETAENLRRRYGISREDQDRYAAESHRRAVAAQEAGRFDEEIVGLHLSDYDGSPSVIDRDEHPRPGTSESALRELTPILLDEDPEATVTAGNASGQNDAAAACVVTTPRRAEELGLVPLVRLVSWAAAGVPPSLMGLGPVPATDRALKRAGLSLEEMDVIELNEAFAVQVLAVIEEWNLDVDDMERVNPNGSGISLGHPVGATGARILSTLAYELQRRDGNLGLETMCIGGGQGMAAVFERVP